MPLIKTSKTPEDHKIPNFTRQNEGSITNENHEAQRLLLQSSSYK